MPTHIGSTTELKMFPTMIPPQSWKCPSHWSHHRVENVPHISPATELKMSLTLVQQESCKCPPHLSPELKMSLTLIPLQSWKCSSHLSRHRIENVSNIRPATELKISSPKERSIPLSWPSILHGHTTELNMSPTIVSPQSWKCPSHLSNLKVENVPHIYAATELKMSLTIVSPQSWKCAPHLSSHRVLNVPHICPSTDFKISPTFFQPQSWKCDPH